MSLEGASSTGASSRALVLRVEDIVAEDAVELSDVRGIEVDVRDDAALPSGDAPSLDGG